MQWKINRKSSANVWWQSLKETVEWYFDNEGSLTIVAVCVMEMYESAYGKNVSRS